MVIFYVLSIAASSLIIPSTFAAPIWPAAGIGAAVLILCGYRFIPAIIIGEVFVNINLYRFDDLPNGPKYLVAYLFLLAVAILRSLISAYLVKTHLGHSNRYLTSTSVAKLFVFAGIIPALFSSSFSTFILYYSGLINKDAIISNTLAWWFGDAVGIVIILPIMFLFFKKPREIWKPRLWKTFVPVSITLSLLFIVAFNLKDLEKKKVIESLDKHAAQLVDIMMTKLSDDLSHLHRTPQKELVAKMNKLFSEDSHEVIKDEQLKDIHFIIYSHEKSGKVTIFDAQRLIKLSDVAKASRLCDISEHLWEIEAYATSGYYMANGIKLTWWLLSAGFLFSALLSAGLLVITGRNILINYKVKERTKEIQTLNKILIDRERRYKRLIEVQPVIFWKHTRGDKKLTYMSDELVNLLGYDKTDVIDLDTIWNKIVHPDDKSLILSQYIEGVKSGNRFVLKYRLNCKNGDIIWFKDFISTNRVDGNIEVFGMKIDVTKDQENAIKISQLAYYDEMTQLPNRVLFMEYLSSAIKKAIKSNAYGAVLFLDLNRFKVLNDSMGHYFGDQLLKKIGHRLEKMANAEVIPSRFGGDEFVVLLNKPHQSLEEAQQDANTIARNIQKFTMDPFNIDGHSFYTSFSVGISIFPHDSDKPEEIIQQADIAMYTSKTEGNSAIKFFKPEMQELANKRLRVEKSLKTALLNQEFEMYYQPMFDVNKNIVKLEALLRWNHPKVGLVYPGSFIDMAEETGFIIELSEWIIDNIFEQISQWPHDEMTLLPISINISLFQFSNTKIIELLSSASKKYDIDPNMIILELTESIGVGQLEDVLPKLNELKAMGFHIAIDDFGTGYSSLKYLTRMPIDIVKLDKSFVNKIGNNENSETLIEAIVLMIKKLNLNIVVEGVETSEQLEFLQSLGCETFQGFIFSKAIPFEELKMLVIKNHNSNSIINPAQV